MLVDRSASNPGTRIAATVLAAILGVLPAAAQEQTAVDESSSGGGFYGGTTVFGSAGVGVASTFVFGAYLSMERQNTEWQVLNGSIMVFRFDARVGGPSFRLTSDINLVSPSGGYFGFGGGLQSFFSAPTGMLDAHVGLMPASGEGARMELRWETWLGELGGLHLFIVSIGVHRGRPH